MSNPELCLYRSCITTYHTQFYRSAEDDIMRIRSLQVTALRCRTPTVRVRKPAHQFYRIARSLPEMDTIQALVNSGVGVRKRSSRSDLKAHAESCHQ